MSTSIGFRDRCGHTQTNEIERNITRAREGMMPKKTTPTSPLSYAVATMLQPTAVPPALGETGQKLWSAIQAQYAIEDAGGLELLRQACQAADRAERCRKAIDLDGELVEQPNGGTREHALLKAEIAARSFVVRTLSRLGLDMEPLRPGVGRPPGKAGVI
jgi:hypothetical protein